jgi:hypothetical protein
MDIIQHADANEPDLLLGWVDVKDELMRWKPLDLVGGSCSLLEWKPV